MTPAQCIAASAALGFFKSFALGRYCGPRCPPKRASLHSVLLGPVVEEVMYRAAPLQIAGKRLPVGFTALPFALDHILPEAAHGASFGRLLFRALEVGLGGYLYETAYRNGGYFAAVAGHSAHNLAASYGFNIGLRAWERL